MLDNDIEKDLFLSPCARGLVWFRMTSSRVICENPSLEGTN